MSGGRVLDQIEIELRARNDKTLTVYFDVYDSSLARKWLGSLNHLLVNDYHLEKNYCFFGFSKGDRTGPVILDQINSSIQAINDSDLDYKINDFFSMENCLGEQRRFIHEKFNHLHRYFEDLQGVSGAMSEHFLRADAITRWHIRQINLLCHEFESWALSYRKEITAPEWQRPSQLMCWLHAPRFLLDEDDYELFGIETLNRPLGGVFVGVNKAVGKHHWEVFNDEGKDSRIGELTTSTLKSQTEAAGDFDIEWANNPENFPWQQKQLVEFRQWLIDNKFNPNDKKLTIGHPMIGQVNLQRSFGTEDYRGIWEKLNTHQDVYSVKTSTAKNTYEYRWDDPDFIDRQVEIISKGH
jgi:hypothetical protein